jgi:hypothetical protein
MNTPHILIKYHSTYIHKFLGYMEEIKLDKHGKETNDELY